MEIYFLVLIVVVLFAFLSRKSKSKFLSVLLLGIAFVVMVLVAGLRDHHVGTDSMAYTYFFSRIRTFSIAMSYGYELEEYGFWILMWLVHYVSDQYMFLFLAIAIIVIGCYHIAILKYSEFIEISYFVFLTMGFYLFFFNGARQGIACAFYALAVGKMLERSFFKYLIYVMIAFLFHKTALMMIPIYFIVNRPNSMMNNIVTISIGFIAIITMDAIVSVASGIDARYSQYGTAGGGGGYFSVGLSIVLTAFFLRFKEYVQVDRYQYDRFLNMMLVASMIGAVSVLLRLNPSGILRYAAYFDLSTIFLWPIVFKNLGDFDRLARFVIGYSFAIFYIVFFVATTMTFSNFTPYIFNPILSKIF